MNKYSKCFLTGKKIPRIIEFGKMPIANEFHKSKKDKVYYFNMSLSFNKKYSLAQANAPSPKNCLINNMHFYLQLQKVWKNILKQLLEK